LITGLEAGGAERMLTRLASGSDRDRFASLVVSMTAGGAMAGILTRTGIRVETLEMPRGLLDPRGIVRLLRILRKWRPHVLQTWLYHADLLGLCARLLSHAPRLLWNIRCTESVGSAALRRILSSCSALPDGVVVNSVAGQQFHQQRLGYHPKRWEYIPNGFDTRELRPDEGARHRLRGELGIAETATVIGMAARHHPMKDHTNFLAAAARLAERRADVVFVLAGSGITSDNRAIAAAIGGHGLTRHMRLLGERTDMTTVYPAFDIATLSSAFGEGCPNALGEAMACGVPCVATDSGDSAQLLGDTGLVVPPRDPAALSAAWERFADMPSDERRGYGRIARERIVRNYGIDVIIRRYEALYAEIVAEVGAAVRVGGVRASPQAYAARLQNSSPAVQVSLRGPFCHRHGHCFYKDVRAVFGLGDSVDKPTDSRLFLFADGKRIGSPHIGIGLIERGGAGNFSHWDGTLYFSASDNSDPNTNGCSYTAAMSDELYFAERYAYSRGQVSQLLARLSLTPAHLRGKRVLEVGPGRDMGFALILAGLGAVTVGVEKYKPGWTKDWHSPFIDAICRHAAEDFDGFDPAPLRRCQAINEFDPSCIAHHRTSLEDFSLIGSEAFDITCSQAVLEHVGNPELALNNLLLATRLGGMGLHVIDFRDHRDFAAPLEFLLLDEPGFAAALEGKAPHWFGNPSRFGAWLRLWRNAGFTDVEHVVDTPTIDETYLRHFLPRLRRCVSPYRDTSEDDLRPLGAQFIVQR
jgi:glycosyltransferase involved in cell wall biosynthesis/SAM-dependent methyltransferase